MTPTKPTEVEALHEKYAALFDEVYVLLSIWKKTDSAYDERNGTSTFSEDDAVRLEHGLEHVAKAMAALEAGDNDAK